MYHRSMSASQMEKASPSPWVKDPSEEGVKEGPGDDLIQRGSQEDLTEGFKY